MAGTHFDFLMVKHPESYHLVNYAQNIQLTEPKLAALACLILIKKLINQLHADFCIASSSTNVISQINQPLFVKLLASDKLHKRLKYSAEIAHLAKDNQIFAEKNIQSLLKIIHSILIWWDKLCSECSLPSNTTYLSPKNLHSLFSELDLNNILLRCRLHAFEIQKSLDQDFGETHLTPMLIQRCYHALMNSETTRRLNAQIYNVEAEFDFSSLKIFDYFNQYTLASNHIKLIRQMETFINSSDVPIMIIKTPFTKEPLSVLNIFAQFILRAKINLDIISPTAQSALRQKIGITQQTYTISEFIENEAHSQFSANPDENHYSMHHANAICAITSRVIILHSASLYSDNLNNSNTWGNADTSISTLIKQLNLSCEQPKTKLIIIGDEQALPVHGAHFSSALSQNFIHDHYGLPSLEIKFSSPNSNYNLNTDFSHQATINKLNSNYMPLPHPSEITLSRLSTLSNIKIIDKHFMIKNIFKHFFSENAFGKSRSIVIAYTQTHVDGYNMIIRQEVLNAVAPLVEGERVMTYEHNSLHQIGYQALGVIESLTGCIEKRDVMLLNPNDKTPQSIQLKFQKAIIQFPGYHTVNGYVLMNFLDLYMESSGDCKLLIQALEQDFINRMKIKHGSDNLNKQQLAIEMKNDIYLNSLKIKYAYAQTVHQAYPCSWSNVLIDCRGYADSDPYYFQRWLYTVVSSTSGKIYLLNAPLQQLQSISA